MTSMHGKSFSYDIFDRLTTGSKGYDAFGKRVVRDAGDGTTRLYFYGPSGQLLTEYTYQSADDCDFGSGPTFCSWMSVSKRYTYFAGNRVGQWTDRIGSKRKEGSTQSDYYP